MAYRQRKYVKVAKNRDSFDNGNPRGFRWGTFRYSTSSNYQAIAIAKVVYFLTYNEDLATTSS